MKKKILTMLLSTIIVTMLLLGCGDSSGKGDSVAVSASTNVGNKSEPKKTNSNKADNEEANSDDDDVDAALMESGQDEPDPLAENVLTETDEQGEQMYTITDYEVESIIKDFFDLFAESVMNRVSRKSSSNDGGSAIDRMIQYSGSSLAKTDSRLTILQDYDSSNFDALGGIEAEAYSAANQTRRAAGATNYSAIEYYRMTVLNDCSTNLNGGRFTYYDYTDAVIWIKFNVYVYYSPLPMGRAYEGGRMVASGDNKKIWKAGTGYNDYYYAGLVNCGGDNWAIKYLTKSHYPDADKYLPPNEASAEILATIDNETLQQAFDKYTAYCEDNLGFFNRYKCVYIDEDDIPELLVTDESSYTAIFMLSYNNDSVPMCCEEFRKGYSRVWYIEKENVLFICGFDEYGIEIPDVYKICSIENGEFITKYEKTEERSEGELSAWSVEVMYSEFGDVFDFGSAIELKEYGKDNLFYPSLQEAWATCIAP